MSWEEAQKWERAWHGDCIRTELGEEIKQIEYAKRMGLEFFNDGKSSYNIQCHGRSIVDIGGGPCSLLLKADNADQKIVIEPMQMPLWVYQRYKAAGISVISIKGEDLRLKGFDEAWIYNVLAHTENPRLVIERAKIAARTIRIFEWINMGISPGHLQSLTKEDLDLWLGKEGHTERLSDKERNLHGWCYYGEF